MVVGKLISVSKEAKVVGILHHQNILLPVFAISKYNIKMTPI